MHDALRTFITAEIMNDPDYPLKNEEELISGGLIDSFSLVELQIFIEQTFDVRVPDTELTAEAIDTINDLVAVIEKTQADS